MKKIIFFALCLTVSTLASVAQNAFFPAKEGLVQVYANKNAKGKIQSQTRQTITKVTGSGSNMTIAYESEVLNAKGKSSDPALVLDYEVEIKNGAVVLDLKSLLGASSLTGINIEAEGEPMVLPANLKEGDAIEDCDVSVQIGFIKTTAAMTDGKCEAIEDVTTEAGTFQCWKITQTVNAKVMGIKSNGSQTTWYAKGVGQVKSETYDKKGKLQSSVELISME